MFNEIQLCKQTTNKYIFYKREKFRAIHFFQGCKNSWRHINSARQNSHTVKTFYLVALRNFFFNFTNRFIKILASTQACFVLAKRSKQRFISQINSKCIRSSLLPIRNNKEPETFSPKAQKQLSREHDSVIFDGNLTLITRFDYKKQKYTRESMHILIKMSDKIQITRFKKYNADQFGVFMVSTQVQGNKANMRTTFIHSRHRLCSWTQKMKIC